MLPCIQRKCFEMNFRTQTNSNVRRFEESKDVSWSYQQILIGRTHADPEAPILWLPDVKGQLPGRDPDAGED